MHWSARNDLRCEITHMRCNAQASPRKRRAKSLFAIVEEKRVVAT